MSSVSEGAGRDAERDAIHFPFAFTEAYRLAARPFGVRPDNALVEVGERTLRASFGRWLVQTPLTNITGVAITGPYHFVKTAGPARLAVSDRGITFATNGERGVCITFGQRVWGFDRLGLIRHPNLTVTVREVDRLAALLEGRSHLAAGLAALR